MKSTIEAIKRTKVHFVNFLRGPDVEIKNHTGETISIDGYFLNFLRLNL